LTSFKKGICTSELTVLIEDALNGILRTVFLNALFAPTVFIVFKSLSQLFTTEFLGVVQAKGMGVPYCKIMGVRRRTMPCD